MKDNATSIAFVVDQLSPDTVSLSLQDEALLRLLQQSPVRSLIQNYLYLRYPLGYLRSYA